MSWDVATAMVRLANEVKTVAVKSGKEEGIKKSLGPLRCQEQGRRKRNENKTSSLDFWKNSGTDGESGQHHSQHIMVSESIIFSNGFKYIRLS